LLANKVEMVWNRFREFLVIFSCNKIDLRRLPDKKRWIDLTREWEAEYKRAFGLKRVTSYIHLVVEHSQQVLERLGCLQKYGSFALESKHAETDVTYHMNTNQKSHTPKSVLLHHILLECYPFPISHHSRPSPWHEKFVDILSLDIKSIVIEK
jgi:hypothetical protein